MSENKVHWKKIVSDPNFIGEGDFQEGEEKIVTIQSVNQSETVTTAEGKSQKAVVHFAENGIKPMILNVARSKAIEKVSGSGYVEDWAGTKITLFIEHGIKAFGEVVSAVRVRKVKPHLTASAPIPPCSDCHGEIVAAMGKTAAFMAAYTVKNYKVPLCADCASKRKEAEKAAQETVEEMETAEVPADGVEPVGADEAQTDGTVAEE